MTQTKWINVNGNLYEGAIETVQNWDGSERKDVVIATLVIDGISIRNAVNRNSCYNSPTDYYMYMLRVAEQHLAWAKDALSTKVEDIKECSAEINDWDAEVKMWQSKLDLLKHES